jgi:hypothetical protein
VRIQALHKNERVKFNVFIEPPIQTASQVNIAIETHYKLHMLKIKKSGIHTIVLLKAWQYHNGLREM